MAHQRDISHFTGSFMAGTSIPARKSFRVTRVKWGKDPGYDENGTYWGIGAPVYEVEDVETGDYGYLRSSDMSGAKAKVTAKFPGAKFVR